MRLLFVLLFLQISWSLTLPIDGVTTLTGTFYEKRGDVYHCALDIPAHVHTPVRAVAAGKVIEAGYQYPYANYSRENYGNYIKIRDKDGNVWLYAHLHKYIVLDGDKVDEGQVIGGVGWTGLFSCRPHLHLAKYDENNRPVFFTKDFGITWRIR